MKQLPNAKRQAEILKEIEIAEQKAREMAEFADKIAKKWEQRLPKNPAAKQKVGETN
ncbi:hypothetical protein [Floridanema evergladense]|uniref:Uncharacterized protein n=1 Tax=Floridaenema evergladense BLCC-F167 TaxID=3153639 RepID=A0ABV4WJM6_9CYAN